MLTVWAILLLTGQVLEANEQNCQHPGQLVLKLHVKSFNLKSYKTHTIKRRLSIEQILMLLALK